MAGIFKLTLPSAHRISTLRLKRNRVNGIATEHRRKRHVSTRRLAHCDSAPRGKEGGREEREKKSAIDQICLSHPPHLASIHSQSGTSYITVPLFHLEREMQISNKDSETLRESKTECTYHFKRLDLFVFLLHVIYHRPNFGGGCVKTS